MRFSDSVLGGKFPDCQEYNVQIYRDEKGFVAIGVQQHLKLALGTDEFRGRGSAKEQAQENGHQQETPHCKHSLHKSRHSERYRQGWAVGRRRHTAACDLDPAEGETSAYEGVRKGLTPALVGSPHCRFFRL